MSRNAMVTAGEQSEQQRLIQRFGREFSAGEVIFKAGDPAREAFLLQDGRVRLIKTVAGIDRSLRVVRPGDLFGQSAFVEGSVRTSTAVALADGAALALEPDTFEQVLTTNPAVAMRLLQQLARRLRDAEDQIELLMLGDSQVKIVVALLQLAEGLAEGDNASVISATPMELSARVGLDVETVKRNVQQLRNNDYVRIVDEQIEIPDIDALRELRALLDVKDSIVGQPS